MDDRELTELELLLETDGVGRAGQAPTHRITREVPGYTSPLSEWLASEKEATAAEAEEDFESVLLEGVAEYYQPAAERRQKWQKKAQEWQEKWEELKAEREAIEAKIALLPAPPEVDDAAAEEAAADVKTAVAKLSHVRRSHAIGERVYKNSRSAVKKAEATAAKAAEQAEHWHNAALRGDATDLTKDLARAAHAEAREAAEAARKISALYERGKVARIWASAAELTAAEKAAEAAKEKLSLCGLTPAQKKEETRIAAIKKAATLKINQLLAAGREAAKSRHEAEKQAEKYKEVESSKPTLLNVVFAILDGDILAVWRGDKDTPEYKALIKSAITVPAIAGTVSSKIANDWTLRIGEEIFPEDLASLAESADAELLEWAQAAQQSKTSAEARGKKIAEAYHAAISDNAKDAEACLTTRARRINKTKARQYMARQATKTAAAADYSEELVAAVNWFTNLHFYEQVLVLSHYPLFVRPLLDVTPSGLTRPLVVDRGEGKIPYLLKLAQQEDGEDAALKVAKNLPPDTAAIMAEAGYDQLPDAPPHLQIKNSL